MPVHVLPSINDLEQLMRGTDGKPFVYEAREERFLQFNCMAVQSAMRLSEPYELELSYTRAMMGFLLFNLVPQNILIVGLGGGSLSKFCYKNVKSAHVTTLEISEEVIALRDQFLIPADDDRFSVVHTDAADYLSGAYIKTDVILLDGFDGEGMPDRLCTETFYEDCKRALDRQGVMAANLWGSVSDVAACLDRIQKVFNGQVWCARVKDGSNIIAFAVKDESYYPHWRSLIPKANRLQECFGLDLPYIVENMRRRPQQGL